MSSLEWAADDFDGLLDSEENLKPVSYGPPEDGKYTFEVTEIEDGGALFSLVLRLDALNADGSKAGIVKKQYWKGRNEEESKSNFARLISDLNTLGYLVTGADKGARRKSLIGALAKAFDVGCRFRGRVSSKKVGEKTYANVYIDGPDEDEEDFSGDSPIPFDPPF